MAAARFFTVQCIDGKQFRQFQKICNAACFF